MIPMQKRQELVVIFMCSMLLDENRERSREDEIGLVMELCKVTRKWASLAYDRAECMKSKKDLILTDLDRTGLSNLLFNVIDSEEELEKSESWFSHWERFGVVEKAVMLWSVTHLVANHSKLFEEKGFFNFLNKTLVDEEKMSYRLILSESIRLVRKFSSRHSATFINVVLDRLCQVVGLKDEA